MIEQQWISQSCMIHSKQEVLEYMDNHQIQFPEHLKPKLLKWNSFPIMRFCTEEIEVSFGTFFYQIIQLSQIKSVRDKFFQFLNYKLSDFTKDLLIKLGKCIFQKDSLDPFPQSFEFKSIGDYLQESFIYEKHVRKNPSFYKCLNGIQVEDLNENDIKYRIVLFQAEQQNAQLIALFFSTNYDITQLKQQNLDFFFENYSNQIKFQSQIDPSHYQQSQNNLQEQKFATQCFSRFITPVVNKNQVQFKKINSYEQQPQQQQEAQVYAFNQWNNNFNNTQSSNSQFQHITENQQSTNSNIQLFNDYKNQNNNYSQYNNNGFQDKMNQQYNTYNTLNQSRQQQQQQYQQFQYQKSNIVHTQGQYQLQKSSSLGYPSQNSDINYNERNKEFSQKLQSHIVQMNQQSSQEDVLSTQVINSLHENKIVQPQARIVTYVQQQENYTCQICTEIYNEKQNQVILTPCCQQKLHKECVLEDLFFKAKQNMNFKNVNCFSCEKSLENNEEFIKQNITKQLFGEIVKKQVLANIPLKCFSCQLPIDVGQEILSQQIQIECKRCQKKLCSLCRQEYHGKNKQNQQCPSLSIEIQKAMQDQPVLVCPFCNLMQTKDDNCNHVRCFGCNNQLCSACSVDRVPITSHGNHYHRQGCKDYQPWIVKGQKITKEEFDKKKCERCKQSNKPCSYPISLEEYKKQKKF